MGKKDFLGTWKGRISHGQSEKWGRSSGTSLQVTEQNKLSAGKIVVHAKKGTLPALSKVFVKDEEGSLYSLIILTTGLESLKKELYEKGWVEEMDNKEEGSKETDIV